MKNTNNPGRRGRGREGFTLVEALLSLAITALLMAALGSAVFTTLKSYSENERIATSTQVARAVLQRMMKEVRSCAAISTNSTTITLIPPDANVAQQIRYRYDSSDKQLYYDKTVGGVMYSYPACGENGTVTDFTVSTVMAQNGVDPVCITVTMTLKVGDETFVFTASAAPRRNQTF